MTDIEKFEEIRKKNGAIEDLDIKPGDVKYVYVVLEEEGYQQEIAKGIYLFKEKDIYNATWYTFSIMEKDTLMISSLPYFIFDTKSQIEDFVKVYEAQFAKNETVEVDDFDWENHTVEGVVDDFDWER